jgi:thioredoxin-like negative regulator of GroEL
MSARPEPKPAAANEADTRPRLLFFYSDSSGRSRRVEGFLAQVLQRRRNHDTFRLYRVDCNARPDLTQRFGIEHPPTLVVVENKHIAARIEQPGGCTEIQKALAFWLR